MVAKVHDAMNILAQEFSKWEVDLPRGLKAVSGEAQSNYKVKKY